MPHASYALQCCICTLASGMLFVLVLASASWHYVRFSVPTVSLKENKVFLGRGLWAGRGRGSPGRRRRLLFVITKLVQIREGKVTASKASDGASVLDGPEKSSASSARLRVQNTHAQSYQASPAFWFNFYFPCQCYELTFEVNVYVKDQVASCSTPMPPALCKTCVLLKVPLNSVISSSHVASIMFLSSLLRAHVG